jgi:hypothetical protein
VFHVIVQNIRTRKCLLLATSRVFHSDIIIFLETKLLECFRISNSTLLGTY